MLTVVDENYGGWDAEILAAFETMEVGALADFYFSEIDLDPDCGSKRIKQVEAVMERRGLSFDDLLAAWPNGETEVEAKLSLCP